MSVFWLNVNLNDRVRYKITPLGLERLRRKREADNRESHGAFGEFVPPQVDADGWSETQLWCLFEEFGPFIHIGMSEPLETTIQIQIIAP